MHKHFWEESRAFLLEHCTECKFRQDIGDFKPFFINHPQYFYEFFELLFAFLCSKIEQWLNANSVLKKFKKTNINRISIEMTWNFWNIRSSKKVLCVYKRDCMKIISLYICCAYLLRSRVVLLEHWMLSDVNFDRTLVITSKFIEKYLKLFDKIVRLTYKRDYLKIIRLSMIWINKGRSYWNTECFPM